HLAGGQGVGRGQVAPRRDRAVVQQQHFHRAAGGAPHQAFVAQHDVVAVAAGQGVVAVAADDDVVAALRVDLVVLVVADEDVVLPAGDAGGGVRHLADRAAGESDGAAVADQPVVAVAAGYGVVARAAHDHVVAVVTGDGVRTADRFADAEAAVQGAVHRPAA